MIEGMVVTLMISVLVLGIYVFIITLELGAIQNQIDEMQDVIDRPVYGKHVRKPRDSVMFILADDDEENDEDTPYEIFEND